MSRADEDSGSAGEKIAEDYLREKGYRILERNWRVRQGEIDLICQDGKVYVFVEVKTRQKGTMSLPGQALTKKKQERLVRAASVYISLHQGWNLSYRFDFVAVIIKDRQQVSVEHEQDVIDFSYAVGRSDPAWQPW